MGAVVRNALPTTFKYRRPIHERISCCVRVHGFAWVHSKVQTYIVFDDQYVFVAVLTVRYVTKIEVNIFIKFASI